MRKKLQYREIIRDFPEHVYDRVRDAGTFLPWLEERRQKKPLHIELGTGTGDYLCSQAQQHPDAFYLAVEVKEERIYQAFRKAEERGLKNILFLQAAVEDLGEYHLPAAEDIAVFFPDPWPKKKHLKRRLCAPSFLAFYDQQLKPEGSFLFKTDQKRLFEYAKDALKDEGWVLIEEQAGFETQPEDQTAYEKRFLKDGERVYYLRAQK